jgi:aconitate hydratase
VQPREFNSYGSRRGNHEVMMRGTFANIRIRNEMLDGVEGGYTKGPDGEQMSIYDAAMAYQAQGTPLVVIGGEQYGAGSSRDWAAKGTALLGVKAVIAENFERIHRSNLVGMGVIPFEFTGGDTRKTLELTGEETFSIHGLDGVRPGAEVPCSITYADGSEKTITLKCRIDTAVEIEYIENGGVLHYVLRNLARAA